MWSDACAPYSGIQLVSERPVSCLPLRAHSGEHGHEAIDVVIHQDVPLPCLLAMEPAHVLRKGALPRDGHRQEQRIEPRVIEPLSQIASR